MQSLAYANLSLNCRYRLAQERLQVAQDTHQKVMLPSPRLSIVSLHVAQDTHQKVMVLSPRLSVVNLELAEVSSKPTRPRLVPTPPQTAPAGKSRERPTRATTVPCSSVSCSPRLKPTLRQTARKSCRQSFSETLSELRVLDACDFQLATSNFPRLPARDCTVPLLPHRALGIASGRLRPSAALSAGKRRAVNGTSQVERVPCHPAGPMPPMSPRATVFRAARAVGHSLTQHIDDLEQGFEEQRLQQRAKEQAEQASARALANLRFHLVRVLRLRVIKLAAESLMANKISAATRVQAVRRGSVTRRTHKAAHAVQVSFHPSALMY